MSRAGPSGVVGRVGIPGVHASKAKTKIGHIGEIENGKSVQSFDLAELPANCLPNHHGKFHVIIFNLARHLRSRYPDTTADDCLSVARQWHDEYQVKHKGVEWQDVKTEFVAAWRRIKIAAGESFIDQIKEKIDMSKPIPPELEQLFYDEKMWRAVQCCQEAARIRDDGVFFMSCRSLAPMVDVEFRTAANMLKGMVGDGLLEILEKGGRYKATSYRWIWPHPIFDATNDELEHDPSF